MIATIKHDARKDPPEVNSPMFANPERNELQGLIKLVSFSVKWAFYYLPGGLLCCRIHTCKQGAHTT
eukprot:3565602-Prorocentrum_lima.AAC.1